MNIDDELDRPAGAGSAVEQTWDKLHPGESDATDDEMSDDENDDEDLDDDLDDDDLDDDDLDDEDLDEDDEEDDDSGVLNDPVDTGVTPGERAYPI